MSTDEINWVNEYHDRVLAELAPDLDGEDLEWLRQACRPL